MGQSPRAVLGLIALGFLLMFLGRKGVLEALIMIPMGLGMATINAAVMFFDPLHGLLVAGDALAVQVTPATAAKCERCWHYRDDVGSDAAHPTLCGRCTSNLFGAGEVRTVA